MHQRSHRWNLEKLHLAHHEVAEESVHWLRARLDDDWPSTLEGDEEHSRWTVFDAFYRLHCLPLNLKYIRAQRLSDTEFQLRFDGLRVSADDILLVSRRDGGAGSRPGYLGLLEQVVKALFVEHVPDLLICLLYLMLLLLSLLQILILHFRLLRPFRSSQRLKSAHRSSRATNELNWKLALRCRRLLGVRPHCKSLHF